MKSYTLTSGTASKERLPCDGDNGWLGSKRKTAGGLRMTEWCILRTSGRKTLALADELMRQSIEAWTPRETRKRRLPRSRAVEKQVVPIMPTFVFAPTKHIMRLAMESNNYKSQLPSFSIQLYNGKYPLVADSELRALRDAERRSVPLEDVCSYKEGDIVKMTEGSFAGLSGIVQTSDGKNTLIAFPNSKLAIKISTLLLRQEYARDGQIAA